LFHCTNSYFIPNVKATAYSCRTHLPPNTAFRGFGGPQGMFVIEAAISLAAEKLGMDTSVLQKKNLIRTGEEFPYGQIAQSEALECWEKAESLYQADALRKRSRISMPLMLYSKGHVLPASLFSDLLHQDFMNHARALVHVYTDGQRYHHDRAVEMGQGVEH